LASCLIVAGEKSGEEHVLSFFSELKRLVPEVNFFGVGGDELENQGMELIYHLREFSSMGFSEVLSKIPFYIKSLSFIESEVIRRGTQVAILVDFQDFNLRLARRLSKQGVKVLYYVAPQAWAWKSGRVKALAETVHTLFTILPFEKDWFLCRGVQQVRSIPHPLLIAYKNELSNIPQKPFNCWEKKLKILLLPGSRKFEVESLLPIFLDSTKKLRDFYSVEIHLVKVAHISSKFYSFYESEIDVFYESYQLPEAMRESHFALAASGTVTLSTALFELPTVVCYKTSLLNQFIFNNFIDYRGFISLTNIIHNELVFPELLQDSVTPHLINGALKLWLENKLCYNTIKEKLKKTKNLLHGESFSVPQYMAQVINE
jgi:lipid-A-disaccharide synthase